MHDIAVGAVDLRELNVKASALLLLAAAVSAQFSWQWAPPKLAGTAWTASQGLYSSLLLVALMWAYRRSGAMLAASWLALLWQGLTAWCSISYMLAPWPATSGSRCSAAFDAPVGGLALLLALALAWAIYRGN